MKFVKGVCVCAGGRGREGESQFLMGVMEPEQGWFSYSEPFSNLKTAFCGYWTLIKIKISVNCVQRVQNGNKNGTGAMPKTKNEIFIRLEHENCYLVEGGGGLTFGRVE